MQPTIQDVLVYARHPTRQARCLGQHLPPRVFIPAHAGRVGWDFCIHGFIPSTQTRPSARILQRHECQAQHGMRNTFCTKKLLLIQHITQQVLSTERRRVGGHYAVKAAVPHSAPKRVPRRSLLQRSARDNHEVPKKTPGKAPKGPSLSPPGMFHNWL